MTRALHGTLLALALLGLACDPSGDGSSVEVSAASAAAALSPRLTVVRLGSSIRFEVLLELTDEFPQAVDISLAVDPAILRAFAASPHPDFDDDGRLLMPANIDEEAGVISRIVDVRHSPGIGNATIGVARVEFVGIAPGITKVSIDVARASTPDGEAFSIATLDAFVAVTPW